MHPQRDQHRHDGEHTHIITDAHTWTHGLPPARRDIRRCNPPHRRLIGSPKQFLYHHAPRPSLPARMRRRKDGGEETSTTDPHHGTRRSGAMLSFREHRPRRSMAARLRRISKLSLLYAAYLRRLAAARSGRVAALRPAGLCVLRPQQVCGCCRSQLAWRCACLRPAGLARLGRCAARGMPGGAHRPCIRPRRAVDLGEAYPPLLAVACLSRNSSAGRSAR